MAETPRSYSTQQVAQRLGVSTQTVQRWVDAGHLKAWKTVGGHRRIDAESAERMFREASAALGPLAAEPSATTLRVLVVDDNPDDREILSHIVRQALPTAEIVLADNGFEGLMAVGRLAPQILVTDVLMPHMDGFEMLRHICSEGAVRPQYIVAVSSHSAEELAQRGTLPPDVVLIAKPVARGPLGEWLREAALALTTTERQPA